MEEQRLQLPRLLDPVISGGRRRRPLTAITKLTVLFRRRARAPVESPPLQRFSA